MSLLLNRSNPSAAVDSLEQLFVKASNDLSCLQHKLESELDAAYASNVNPLRLLCRLKKIQEELPLLEDECHKLLAAKQELIDNTKKTLLSNRAMLLSMQARAGIPVIGDSDDPIYSSFMNILHEWNSQLDLETSEGQYAPEDLNQKLFSSKVGETNNGS